MIVVTPAFTLGSRHPLSERDTSQRAHQPNGVPRYPRTGVAHSDSVLTVSVPTFLGLVEKNVWARAWTRRLGFVHVQPRYQRVGKALSSLATRPTEGVTRQPHARVDHQDHGQRGQRAPTSDGFRDRMRLVRRRTRRTAVSVNAALVRNAEVYWDTRFCSCRKDVQRKRQFLRCIGFLPRFDAHPGKPQRRRCGNGGHSDPLPRQPQLHVISSVRWFG